MQSYSELHTMDEMEVDTAIGAETSPKETSQEQVSHATVFGRELPLDKTVACDYVICAADSDSIVLRRLDWSLLHPDAECSIALNEYVRLLDMSLLAAPQQLSALREPFDAYLLAPPDRDDELGYVAYIALALQRIDLVERGYPIAGGLFSRLTVNSSRMYSSNAAVLHHHTDIVVCDAGKLRAAASSASGVSSFHGTHRMVNVVEPAECDVTLSASGKNVLVRSGDGVSLHVNQLLPHGSVASHNYRESTLSGCACMQRVLCAALSNHEALMAVLYEGASPGVPLGAARGGSDENRVATRILIMNTKAGSTTELHNVNFSDFKPSDDKASDDKPMDHAAAETAARLTAKSARLTPFPRLQFFVKGHHRVLALRLDAYTVDVYRVEAVGRDDNLVAVHLRCYSLVHHLCLCDADPSLAAAEAADKAAEAVNKAAEAANKAAEAVNKAAEASGASGGAISSSKHAIGVMYTQMEADDLAPSELRRQGERVSTTLYGLEEVWFDEITPPAAVTMAALVSAPSAALDRLEATAAGASIDAGTIVSHKIELPAHIHMFVIDSCLAPSLDGTHVLLYAGISRPTLRSAPWVAVQFDARMRRISATLHLTDAIIQPYTELHTQLESDIPDSRDIFCHVRLTPYGCLAPSSSSLSSSLLSSLPSSPSASCGVVGTILPMYDEALLHERDLRDRVRHVWWDLTEAAQRAPAAVAIPAAAAASAASTGTPHPIEPYNLHINRRDSARCDSVGQLDTPLPVLLQMVHKHEAALGQHRERITNELSTAYEVLRHPYHLVNFEKLKRHLENDNSPTQRQIPRFTIAQLQDFWSKTHVPKDYCMPATAAAIAAASAAAARDTPCPAYGTQSDVARDILRCLYGSTCILAGSTYKLPEATAALTAPVVFRAGVTYMRERWRSLRAEYWQPTYEELKKLEQDAVST